MSLSLIIGILSLLVGVVGLITGASAQFGGGIKILTVLISIVIAGFGLYAIIARLQKMPNFNFNNPTSMFITVALVVVIIIIVIKGVSGEL